MRRTESGRRRRTRLFLHESRALARLAGPIMLSQLGAVGMNTTDTIMVGPLGAGALAAVGLASALHVTTLMLCTGTLLGMSPLVSQAFGAGDRLECRRVLVQGLWLSLLLTIPVVWITLQGERMALLLGQDPQVAKDVGAYLYAIAWGVLPVALFFAIRQFLDGMGLTRPAMVMTFLGLVLNFFGNKLLIYGWEGAHIPAMGLVGSGWATTVSRWAMLLALVAYLWVNPQLHPLQGISLRPVLSLVRRIAAIGTPAGAMLALEIGLFALAAVMMGWFGPVELGAHQVTLNLASTTFQLGLGVSLAGSIRVGHHLGARSGAGARRAARATYLLAMGAMGLCALVFLGAPGWLLHLYTDDPGVLQLGTRLLYIAALFQLFDAAQVSGVCVLRGAADTRVPAIIATVAYLAVGLPTAYLLGFHTPLGPVGIWTGLCLALATAALLLGARVRRVLARPAVMQPNGG